jgi:hypothetical protein
MLVGTRSHFAGLRKFEAIQDISKYYFLPGIHQYYSWISLFCEEVEIISQIFLLGLGLGLVALRMVTELRVEQSSTEGQQRQNPELATSLIQSRIHGWTGIPQQISGVDQRHR